MSTPPELVKRFMELYVGGDHAHGIWEFDTGDCRTEKKPATEQDYIDHLDGIRGLGLIPVNTKGECRFGAIDIDDDDIDHAALYKAVAERNLPLNVCRSKSGGAHCYAFTKEPVRASALIAALKKWALILGYARSEIFPKQSRVSQSNLGNWINLSYFANERTVRYAVGPNGSLTLQEFLDTIIYWDGETVVNVIESNPIPFTGLEGVKTEDMPPCLVSITKEGLTQGLRDMGMFNLAVFYRKSNPNKWQDLIVQHNQKFVSPPLTNREIQKIIRSVGQRHYQYTCNQEPCSSHCDRNTCVKLPFGVGHEPWKGEAQYADLQMGNCRKIMTDPPKFLVEVNGKDIDVTTEQLLNFKMFQRRVFELTSTLLFPHKSDHWDVTIIDLMTRTKEVEAPADASESGMVFEKVLDFLALIERSRGNREDLLRGLPVETEDNKNVAFRVADLQKYLKAQFVKVSNEMLYQILHAQECRYGSMRIKGKVVSVWLFPHERLNLQTEEFTPPKITTPEDDL